MKKIIRLTESNLHDIIYQTLNKLFEANNGNITSKVAASVGKKRQKFDADAVLKRALSYETISDIYKDKNLSQMLRYHRMPDGRRYLDYVQDYFKKNGKMRTSARGTNRIERINWTPQTALEYASNFTNGHELREEPSGKGRSCFYYLKTRDNEGNLIKKGDTTKQPLFNMAIFSKARIADANKAGDILIKQQKKLEKANQLNKERREKEALDRREERKKATRINNQERKNKERENKQAAKESKIKQNFEIIKKYIEDNGIRGRRELFNAKHAYYNYAYRYGFLDALFGTKLMPRGKTANKSQRKIRFSPDDTPDFTY